MFRLTAKRPGQTKPEIAELANPTAPAAVCRTSELSIAVPGSTAQYDRFAPRLTPRDPVSRVVVAILRFAIGYPLRLIYRIPPFLLNLLDFVFVRGIAVLAGASLQPWQFRYGVMLGLVAAVALAGWLLRPPEGLIACVTGIDRSGGRAALAVDRE